MKCKYCGRELINKIYRTKNGCKWCDVEYFKKRKIKCAENIRNEQT